MCKDNQAGDSVIEYRVDKYTFVVSPVFNEKSGKTIHQILLELMKKDSDKSQ